jgi:hypothetical protein
LYIKIHETLIISANCWTAFFEGLSRNLSKKSIKQKEIKGAVLFFTASFVLEKIKSYSIAKSIKQSI